MAKYGKGQGRDRHPSDWEVPKAKEERERVEIDEETQLKIFEVTRWDIECTANRLLRQKQVAECDLDFIQGLMFDACCEAYPNFKESKRSLKGFMKKVVRDWSGHRIASRNFEKRQGEFRTVSLSEFERDEEGREFIDRIVDPRSLEQLEFQLALCDLWELCNRNERIALRILYFKGGRVEDVAARVGMTHYKTRMHVVGPLQLKVDACFGFSETRKLKFILTRAR